MKLYAPSEFYRFYRYERTGPGPDELLPVRKSVTMEDVWKNADPALLLWIATRPGVLSAMAKRRVAVYLARTVRHLMFDTRSLRALQTAEAHGHAQTTKSLDDAREAAAIPASDRHNFPAMAAFYTALDDTDQALTGAFTSAKDALLEDLPENEREQGLPSIDARLCAIIRAASPNFANPNASTEPADQPRAPIPAPAQPSASPYKIEKGVPLPPDGRPGRKPGPRYEVLKQMATGDSVLLSKKDATGVHKAAERIGITVRARKVSDDQVRIWRTA